VNVLATTSVVDAVAKEKGDPEWRLVLEVEKGEWALPRAVWLLEEKLNSYASFALDGRMRELYPHSHPELTRIVVVSADPLPEKAVWLLDKVELALRPTKMKLSWGTGAVGGPPPPTSAGGTGGGTGGAQA
jgi:hypothetical protein